jgi:alpha-glucosidase (family GH31 glycosyl hydrolase)
MHSEDPEAYSHPEEFEFGDSLLAAPVTHPGHGSSASQTVWFPRGGRWYHWFTGKPYAPGVTAEIESDLNEFPLFAKGGEPIFLQPFSERPASAPLAELHVRVYPGEEGLSHRSTLYEDDGISEKYLTGAHGVTSVTYSRAAQDAIAVDVSATEGTYECQLGERSYVFEFRETKPASSATVDGRPTPVEYDPTIHGNVVRVAKRQIGKPFRIALTAPNQ